MEEAIDSSIIHIESLISVVVFFSDCRYLENRGLLSSLPGHAIEIVQSFGAGLLLLLSNNA